MKNSIGALLFALLFGLAVGGQFGCVDRSVDPLTVTLVPSVTSGVAPLTVSFAAERTGGRSAFDFNWSFGDGVDATGQSVSHSFTQGGSYTVTLHASDSGGRTAVDSVVIEVTGNDPPLIAVSAVPTGGIAPLDVDLRCEVAQGEGPFSFVWQFGDGHAASVQHPEHTFDEPGVYSVVVLATDATGETVSAITQITVGSDFTPGLQISAAPMSGIAPLEVQFDSTVHGGNEPLTYAWDFSNDQQIDAEIPTPRHLFETAGEYPVRLSLTDADGDQVEDTLTVTVSEDTSPTVTATATPESGPAPLTASFNCQVTDGNPPFEYLWQFGDDNESTLPSTLHNYTEIGTYSAICTVIDADGDASSDNIVIEVLDPDTGTD